MATGEHAHNRMVFKQLLQAGAIDVCQIDSCRLAGVSEVLSVLLMAAKFGVVVCPHAGGVGLCEYVIHLRCDPRFRGFFFGTGTDSGEVSLIDYISVSGTMERNVLEYVDHLHEHFVNPCSINDKGRYNVPNDPNEGYRCVKVNMNEEVSSHLYFSIEMHQTSIAEYEWPNGTYWAKRQAEGSI